jgi:hypothetical protein
MPLPIIILTLSSLLIFSGCASTNGGKSLETILQPDPQLTTPSPEPSSEPSPEPIPTVTTTPSPTPTPVQNTEISQLISQGVLPENSQPTQIVSRQEYARYLFKVYNQVHREELANQIRLANPTSEPVFTDIPTNHPDYEIIQGMAEAGIIDSKLTGDKTATKFEPDKPLTREYLIGWKVALDRSPTAETKPKSNLQDLNQVNPQLSKRIQTDYQRDAQSNLRRVFGYTTLLQPQKTVTLQEVGIILNLFP